MAQQHQDQLLAHHLRNLLGELEPEALRGLLQRLEWIGVGAGETLMARGEPGDAMYLAISGRLRAYVPDEHGVEHLVREMGRGEVIGEMSLYTDEPRSATVVALRDSVLVRLSKADFASLLAGSVQVSIALTRQIIRRLQQSQLRPAQARLVTVALVPVSDGVDALAFAHRLARQLELFGRVRVVDADALDAELEQPGLVRSELSDPRLDRRVALRLDEIEAAHDYVLLVADPQPTGWTQRCSRCCDEVLLLADADAEPALHANETQCLMRHAGRAEAAERLLLLHPEQRRCPSGTRAWLARRPVQGHVHLRPTLERDIARLARLVSGNAVGLVLAGGGARGCAHLGVYRALHERGIEVDWVGGTSIGAVMGVLVASDRPLDEVTVLARRSFSVNPTGDFNLVPLLSLIAGRRMRRVVDGAVRHLLGHDADVEDLWKNFYCVASNYSQGREHVARHGNLVKAVVASAAIPGALPPVLRDGDLLCDGGTFNNFPVDVMRRQAGVGKVIGVDLGVRRRRRIELDEVPSAWALARDRLRPRRHRRYKLPSLLGYLMNVTILYSTSRQREAQALCDIYLNPPLERVGMLQWERFDGIVEQGHAHAAGVLDALAGGPLRTRRPADAGAAEAPAEARPAAAAESPLLE